jgi:hypothetical protein
MGLGAQTRTERKSCGFCIDRSSRSGFVRIIPRSDAAEYYRPEQQRRPCETESVTLTPGVSDAVNLYGLTKPPWTPCKRRSDCHGRDREPG